MPLSEIVSWQNHNLRLQVQLLRGLPEVSMAYKDKDQHRRRLKERYHTDPEYRAKQLAMVAKNNKERNAKSIAIVLEWKLSGCTICGEKEPACLDAHHIDPSNKSFNVADGVSGQMPARVQKELDKCICLCRNCHAKIHAGVLSLPVSLIGP